MLYCTIQYCAVLCLDGPVLQCTWVTGDGADHLLQEVGALLVAREEGAELRVAGSRGEEGAHRGGEDLAEDVGHGGAHGLEGSPAAHHRRQGGAHTKEKRIKK